MTQIAPAAAKSGLERLQQFIEDGATTQLSESLGYRLVSVGEGWAKFQASATEKVYNPHGTVHGGYVATLLDSACACAVQTRLLAKQGFTTLELKVSYLRSLTAQAPALFAEGRVTTLGRRVGFAEADLKDSTGKLYATASSTLLIFEK